jgi:hypothetical protein
VALLAIIYVQVRSLVRTVLRIDLELQGACFLYQDLYDTFAPLLVENRRIGQLLPIIDAAKVVLKPPGCGVQLHECLYLKSVLGTKDGSCFRTWIEMDLFYHHKLAEFLETVSLEDEAGIVPSARS